MPKQTLLNKNDCSSEYSSYHNESTSDLDSFPKTTTKKKKKRKKKKKKDRRWFETSSEYAWCFLRARNPVRRRLIQLIRWRWFDRCIILVIVINCIMLALYNPMDKKCETRSCLTLEKLEYVVFAFFAMEMVVKITALGIYGRKSYFDDKWNIFDFLIVISGLVDVIGLVQGGFMTIVRLGRILRPLRAINRVPSIRILVSLLMDTIPMLGNVLVLAFLVFSCFGIIGVQMFQGKLRNRCFISAKFSNNSSQNSSQFYIPDSSVDFVCNLENHDSCNDVPQKFPYAECKNLSNATTNPKCIDKNRLYRDCRKDGRNPYYGSIGFDNIAMAFVFIYQVVTLEGWGDLMYLIQDAYSFWTWIYFVTLIIVGSFFLVNLALVVITMQFSETKHREVRLMKKQRNLASSQLSLYSDLRNMWYKIRNCICFTRKGFQSIHHIHQHVHVRAEPFYCQQCKKSFSPEFNPSPPTKQPIPNIEISCFEETNASSNGVKRSASYPGSLLHNFHQHGKDMNGDNHEPTHLLCNSYDAMGKVEDNSETNREMVLLNKKGDDLTPILTKTNCQHDSEATSCGNFLAPNANRSRCASILETNSTSNMISVHAESIAAVKVDGTSHNSINSRTSLSLMINSSGGECIRTKAFVDTDITNTKNGPQVTTLSGTECNIESSTNALDEACISPSTEYSSEVCYDSMFDLRVCDKYYISEEPTMFQRFRLFCKRFSESSKVSYFIMGVIVVNTMCMAVEHHNQPPKLTQVIEYCNIVFILIFFLEMVIKTLGVGFRIYFKSGFNCFDFIIVILSIAELTFNNEGRSFMIFRSLRLLRIFRLVRPMRHQIAVMLRTTSSVMTFFALLFLFMFTFAILGMNLFGGKFIFKGERARSNFDSFVMAMVTVFQILTQEDWNQIMYDGIRATNNWATLYFLSLMTIGYYVLLNLLVAILVEGFTTPLEKQRMAQRLLSMIRQNRKFTTNRTISLPDIRISQVNQGESLEMMKHYKVGIEGLTEPENSDVHLSAHSIRNGRRKTCGDILHGLSINEIITGNAKLNVTPVSCPIECVQQKPKKNDPILLAARTTKFDGNEPTVIEWKSIKSESIQCLTGKDTALSRRWCTFMSPHYLKDRKDWALFIFSKENRLRKLLMTITQSRYFDALILLLIIYSCVLLAMETPTMDQKGKLREIIDTSSFALSWVFFMEMVLKVIAVGFVISKGSYLRDGWNILDFVLVLTSMVDVFFTLYYGDDEKQGKHTEIIKGFRVLRATRALRPLRMIRKAPGLKLVVQTLLYSLKPIGNTVLIAAFFYIVFGILGVQLLRGTFFYCQGEPEEGVVIMNKSDCTNAAGRHWVNHQYNFDNVFEALMALFIVSTKDGWVDIMHKGIDAVGVDQEPKTNHSPGRILYFVSFLLIGGFLVLNMIVGVVVENFQRCQELQEDQDKAKAIIEKWKLCLKQSYNTYWQSYPTWRKWIYKMCKNSRWNIGITIVIFLNIIVMAMEHYEMSKTFEVYLEFSNFVFTGIYILEATSLIVAFGFKRYFQDKWYCFDMLIVVVSVLSIVLETVSLKMIINPTAIKAMRLLRVVRALKLLKAAKGLRFLLDHVAETIPQVTNLGLLFSLLFFVYSCLGMQLFGTLECNHRYPCTGLGKHANFKSLGTSMLTLFRIATGDNWSGILKDTLRPLCDDSPDCKSNCCIARYVSPIFFVTFVLFAQFVLVNIVIAVLMKHLRIPEEKMREKEEKRKLQNAGSQKIASGKTTPVSSRPDESIERAVFNKWHGKIKRKTQAASEDKEEKSYVRIKQSTDDLDNIQLKCYQATSPSKIYQPSSQTFLRPPIDFSLLSLERNLFDKPLRKSSCPDRIKHSYTSEREDFSFNNYSDMNILYHSNYQRSIFLPFLTKSDLSYSNENSNDDSIERNMKTDSFCSSIQVLTENPLDMNNEVLDSKHETYKGSIESFSELEYDINGNRIGYDDTVSTNLLDNTYNATANTNEICIDIPNKKDNSLTDIEDEKRTEDENMFSNNGSNNHSSCILADETDETLLLVDVHAVESDQSKEATTTGQGSSEFIVLDETFNEKEDIELPVIVIHSASDTPSEESVLDESLEYHPLLGGSRIYSSNLNGLPNTIPNVLGGSIARPLVDEEVNSVQTLPSSGNPERKLLDGEDICENLSKNERTLRTCVLNQKCASSEQISMGESCTSPESLNVRERSVSTDSCPFSPCESIASLNVDDTILMDNSSLGSYIIINSDNQEESVT